MSIHRHSIVRCRRSWQLAWAIALAVPPLAVGAQGSIRGEVLAGPQRAPVRGAAVGIAGGSVRVATDSLGHFALVAVPLGERLVIAAAPGFRPETVTVDLDVDVLEISPIVLQPAVQTLSGVAVTGEATSTAARLSGFEERRKFGNGSFIDRRMLDRFANKQTADVLAALAPGVSVRRGRGMKSWAATARAPFTSGGAFGQAGGFQLDRSDLAAGARPACYMDVYLNGALVYNAKASSSGPASAIPLFDLNSISPEQIESIEAYASAAQVPAQFNRTSGGCGVLVIWTRT